VNLLSQITGYVSENVLSDKKSSNSNFKGLCVMVVDCGW